MSIPHIAFYPSDWLAGTRGLSAEETGVYITLICRMYEMAGPIVRDEKRLSRLCGCKSTKTFSKVLEYLIDEGKIVAFDGTLFNERAQKEIQKATKKSSKAQEAAQSRWNRKANKNNGAVDANEYSEHMLGECQSDTDTEVSKDTPPISPQIEEPEKPKKRTSQKLAEKPDCVDDELWSDFKTHRGKSKFTETALKGFQREAEKAKLSLSDAFRISIERNWQGFKADWIKPEDRPAPVKTFNGTETVRIAVHEEPETFDRAMAWAMQHLPNFRENGQEFLTIPKNVAENLRKH